MDLQTVTGRKKDAGGRQICKSRGGRGAGLSGGCGVGSCPRGIALGDGNAGGMPACRSPISSICRRTGPKMRRGARKPMFPRRCGCRAGRVPRSAGAPAADRRRRARRSTGYGCRDGRMRAAATRRARRAASPGASSTISTGRDSAASIWLCQRSRSTLAPAQLIAGPSRAFDSMVRSRLAPCQNSL
jgi:hypothetical protein